MDTQPCTGAEDYMMIGDGEDDASGYVEKFTKVPRDDMLIGWDGLDGLDTQPCTGL